MNVYQIIGLLISLMALAVSCKAAAMTKKINGKG